MSDVKSLLAEVEKLQVKKVQGILPFNITAFVSGALEAAKNIELIADGVAAIAPSISGVKELIYKSQIVQDILKAVELGQKVFAEVAPQLDVLAQDIKAIAETVENAVKELSLVQPEDEEVES